MIVCQYCLFPLVGGTPKKLTDDSTEIIITCTNCKAIFRVECTTLKEPSKKKEEVKNADQVY